MTEAEEGYCPIKTPKGECGAGGECNYQDCWNKMHYYTPTKSIQEKMLNWREHRRREVRWKDSGFKKS